MADDNEGTPTTRTIGAITSGLGSVPAIALSALLVLTWLVGGLFVSQGFKNNTYQLLINTATTIVTFLMVFIIQNTQNRDGRAVQAKLDAQGEALAVLAAALAVKDEHIERLAELVGVEDAPLKRIKAEQDAVRANT